MELNADELWEKAGHPGAITPEDLGITAEEAREPVKIIKEGWAGSSHSEFMLGVAFGLCLSTICAVIGIVLSQYIVV